MATLTSGDNQYSIDVSVSGPDPATGKYKIVIQKPITPLPAWTDELNIEADGVVVFAGFWGWKDQIGPT